MVWIIFMEFVRAGSVSTIVVVVPLYKGSINLSKVNKYLTLSLASFAASVMFTSVCFHLLNNATSFCFDGSPVFFVTACRRLTTALQSLRLSCSLIEVKRCMRLRQLFNSRKGPTSSLLSDAGLSRYCWIASHQPSNKLSNWGMSSGFWRAWELKVFVVCAICEPSGLANSKPPSRLTTASLTVAAKADISLEKSRRWSGPARPHCSLCAKAGTP
mmetsp:Transcript_16553/g.47125  ORF Transcript_16553/g.47125 Transcript_16553/m.47125 type:complete len:215 (+) Transcript_16553:4925-5569(+)